MINTYLLIALIAGVIFLIFYIDKKFKSVGKDENEITDQFAAIGELFAGSEKNIKELNCTIANIPEDTLNFISQIYSSIDDEIT